MAGLRPVGAAWATVVPPALDDVMHQWEAAASTPAAVLLVPEIARLWDYEEPDAVIAALRRIAEDRRTPHWARGYVRWLEGSLLLRLGRVAEAQRVLDDLAFIQQWAFVGPFDNDNEAGWERVYPPEQLVGQSIDLDQVYTGKLREVPWRSFPEPGPPDGAVQLSQLLQPAQAACAYLVTAVRAARPSRTALRFGADGALRIWVNGTSTYENETNRRALPDRDAVGVNLRRGWNQLVVKSCNLTGSWQLYARFTQPDGRPVQGLAFSSAASDLARAAPRGRDSFEVPSLWRFFASPLEADEQPSRELSAQDQANLARFLSFFGGDDPSTHRARDAAEAAVAAQPSVAHLKLLARLHPDRNRRLGALRQAHVQAPARLDLLLALAGEMADGPHPEDAAHLVAQAERRAPDHGLVRLARARLLDDFGLASTALALLEPLARDRGRGRYWQELRAVARNLGRSALEAEAARAYFQSHQDRAGLRIALARHSAEKGNGDAALELLRGGLPLSPLSSGLRLELASLLEARGDLEEARAQHEAALALRPDDGQLYESLTRYLERRGRFDEALVAARRSLDLRPENPWLRQWVSTFSQEAHFEAPYVEEPEQFLARRSDAAGQDLRILLDLKVRRVHQSGQSDEFRQLAFQAVTLEGARRLSAYQVTFTPHRQRLVIETARVHGADGSTREAVSRSSRDLYDPAVRMYYDLRAVTLSFGDLRPGDVVEVRYRLSDVGTANELGDYFGEVLMWQGDVPIDRMVYALLVPEQREFFFREPEMEGLTHRTTEREGVVEHLFEASSIAAVGTEPHMPPLAESVPLLQVSTFQSWEELGQWYWSLVRDQLELSSEQRARARRLAAGRPSELAKVQAIHRHVVQSVRYVALEFGVHRFKPYRVSLVEQRGFGDCKDQASLMVAMLAEVGVAAEIALVRTRRLGRINNILPSLEAFNHAIVHVPGLNLFIDPTAERVAVGDLPAADQGVTVLRVQAEGVAFGSIPLQTADQQGRDLQLALRMDREGAAQGRAVLTTSGWTAGSTRAALDDPAGRGQYLERLLSNYLHGVGVSDVSAADVQRLDHDHRTRLAVTVSNFARREGDALSVPASVASSLATLVSLPERDYPLVLGPPGVWQERLQLALPAGARVAYLPEPVEIESDFARFSWTVTYRPGRPMTIQSSLSWLAERVEPADYPRLRLFVEEVTAARNARIRLVVP